jgi:hypothetical protein
MVLTGGDFVDPEAADRIERASGERPTLLGWVLLATMGHA